MGRRHARFRLSIAVLTAVAVVAAPVAAREAPAAAAAAAETWRPADDGARIVEQSWVDSATVDITVESPALGGARHKVRVLVPKGWSRTAARTWPVVYAFAGGGAGDDHTTWMANTQIENLAARWSTLVAMPYAAPAGGYTNWWNYGKRGAPRWETFHTEELPQLLERNLRAGTRRAVVGISSGGLGALSFAGRHPGMYEFAASYSGVLHATKPGVQAMLMYTSVVVGGASDPFAIWGVPGFDEANWRAHDPYVNAAKLRGTRIYVSAGTTGEPGELDPKDLPLGDAIWLRIVGGVSESFVGETTKSFVRRLRELKIPVTANIYGDGWHNWTYWDRELQTSWPVMMDELGATKTS